jgi:DNA-binding response OmpR family regulator
MSKKILIIEDDLDSQLLMGECLGYENYEVFLAGHGNEALNVVAVKGLPDLIIMDLSLPFITPKDFLEKFRKQQTAKKIPVLIISGKSDIVEQVEQLKANGYLSKPIDIDNLYEKVATLIN